MEGWGQWHVVDTGPLAGGVINWNLSRVSKKRIGCGHALDTGKGGMGMGMDYQQQVTGLEICLSPVKFRRTPGPSAIDKHRLPAPLPLGGARSKYTTYLLVVV